MTARRTLAVAGVGLIGGSVALGARERGLADRVLGFDHDATALDAALGLGAVDEAHLEPGDWLAQVDVLVLAAPTKALPGLAGALLPRLRAGAVVTDVGSVKRPVVEALCAVEWAGGPGRFVGGHPMAGSERAGVVNADPGLLENAVWVLTPVTGTDPHALAAVRGLVEGLGARPIETTPEKHDELVAAVSHLPYLAAVALTSLIDEGDDRGLKALLAAGGFRDLTRVASGDPRMSRDMVADNAGPVREALRAFRRALAELEEALDDPDALLERAAAAKRARDAVPVVKRGLLASRWELVVAVLDRPGEFARITAALAEASVNIKDLEVLSVRESGGAVRLAFEDAAAQEAGRRALEALGYKVRGRNGG
ncbi:MAG TPA: prephenate dehydrogenase [Trueperaceae bacterium]|nr:prephenate dehydrogenase [Trueperaceae bacterium]